MGFQPWVDFSSPELISGLGDNRDGSKADPVVFAILVPLPGPVNMSVGMAEDSIADFSVRI
jgi:hypothetical protein